jgi:Mor family transcriptional regulator
MKYKNAAYVLPPELVQLIQQYIQGTYLYIPVQEESKKPWGACSGSRAMLRKRNKAIAEAHHSGISVRLLAQQYYLTERSIRRILLQHKRGQF